MTWYKEWFGTRYYALLYGHRDEAEAKRWVDVILERTGTSPGARVIDVACGRGRHALWFERAGMRVEGIDISATNIADASRLVPKGHFRVHDMREPFGESTCDLVVSLFTSLGYFEDLRDDQRAIDSCVRALRPGGWFVLDFMNTQRMLAQLVPHEELSRGGVHFRIAREARDGHIVKTIEVDDGGSKHRFEERVQAILPEQLEAMVLRAGATVRDRTDGPDPKPFDPERSERLVLWVQRSDA
ncbi:MAG: methyltransferase domain-containing protein [Flavobacteriales bacterium]|nr:methyltransferase domain-containing protein [Flavobacteriales bacterium]